MAGALDAERQAAVTSLDRWVSSIALGAWSRMTFGDPQGAFVAQVLPVVLPALVAAQEHAAGIGGSYVAATARAAGVATPARVVPRTFSGVTSDGRDLVSLLSQPLVTAYVAHAAGASPAQALLLGAQSLDRITTTQVHDAARAAESVAITGTRRMTGHERVVELGACSRCILLAGRIYRWSDGFLRHPQCRCGMRPWYGELYGATDEPQRIFDQMSPAEQDATFGADSAQAIRDGADLGKIVNARRGMSTAASRRYPGGRLMPEDIYRIAGDDREQAIRLLTANGYLR